jgi:hypothetical protein
VVDAPPDPLDRDLAPEEVEEYQHRAHQIAHIVYGGIIAVTLIAAADDSAHALSLLRILIATGIVLWLAHSFAGAIGHAVTKHQHLRPSTVRACMVDNVSLLLGFLIPLPAIAVGLLEGVDDARAADAAIVVSLVALFGVGIALGREANMRWHGAILTALIYPALGAVVLALELAVAH